MNTQNILDLFDRAVTRFRNNTAIICGNDRLTYGELEERTNKLANFLLVSGIIKGSIVAILSQNSVEVITAIIGILKAGCVFVPLAPDLPEPQLNTILKEVSPQFLLVNSEFLPKISNLSLINPLEFFVICLDRNLSYEDSRYNFNFLKDYAEYLKIEKPNIQLKSDDMCYIYFTSGSTGKPKGIAGWLKAIDHFITWEIKTFGIGESTRISQLTTPSFDAFLRDIFVPLCSGGIVCIPEEIDFILDARKLVEWIDSQQINLIHCVPSLFRSILNEDLDPKKFSDLKYILLAGEPLLPADVTRWMDVYGDRIQLVNLYGASETTMTKFFYFVKPTDREGQSIPIGKPMEGAAALVVDKLGRVCPPGMVGEIYIRTPYRTLGYYNQPTLTNEVFIQNPFSNNPNDIVYKTGDLGRILEDGNFECLGRIDRQVKIRGIRIELGEIENCLRLHQSVRDVAVTDRENADGDRYLCAYVVLNEELELSTLEDFLSQDLPQSKIPSVFVVMEALPRTTSGKVDWRSLPEPDRARQELSRTFIAPRTEIEKNLAQIWKKVLHLEQVGINDNFFKLGGHSLLATQVVSRASKAFQVALPLRILLESPTLADLAQSIETIRWAAQTPPELHIGSALERGEL
jgi:amino acid adenylation domain-containing protein